MNTQPQYSIVIPAYNESARIERAMQEVLSCIRERGWSAELILVDDGSTDDTAALIASFAANHPEVTLLSNPGNRGKGYSVRSGLLQARGSVVMFTDADLSAPICEAQLLFDAIRDGADLAIGSRWLERSRQTDHQPLYRQFFGRCFNLVTRAVVGLPFADTQCGFKAFRHDAAQSILPMQTIERWGFDPEILFIALRRNLRIAEVPVTWGHDERSRISYLRDGIQMLLEIALIRWNALRGRYNTNRAPLQHSAKVPVARTGLNEASIAVHPIPTPFLADTRRGTLPCYGVIVPTLNASSLWPQFSAALLQCVPPENVLILDSESTDGTSALAAAAGFRVITIPSSTFNHGATRQRGADLLPQAEVLIFMTQDAILADPKSISRLLAPFADPDIAAAYGRQLPRPGAGTIETHARLFNYPDQSQIRTLDSRQQFGIRAAFLSNSLAAYRRSALIAVGGFPDNVIFGEDMVTAAHLLLDGKHIAYVADSTVWHSHSHTWMQEFRRSFDIGVMHNQESWLLAEFGSATGEAKRFIFSELRFVYRNNLLLLPSVVVRTILKVIGYRLGRNQAKLPHWLKLRLSMHSGYWKDHNAFSKSDI